MKKYISIFLIIFTSLFLVSCSTDIGKAVETIDIIHELTDLKQIMKKG